MPNSEHEEQHGPNIHRSTIINIVGAIIPGTVLILTAPLYLHYIGTSRYGILTIVWLMLGYFGAFNLGIGRAISNGIARLKKAPHEERTSLFWTAIFLSTLFGIIGAGVVFLLGKWLFIHVFQVSTDLKSETIRALPWIAIALPLITLISVLVGTLEGRQAFLALNIGQATGLILSQIFPLIVSYAGWKSLSYLVLSALVGRMIGGVILVYFCQKELALSFTPKLFLGQVRPLLYYGTSITISNVVNPLLTVFDRFVIGTKIGMPAVAIYTIPYKLVSYVSILPLSLTTTLFPRYAIVSPREAHNLMIRALTIISVIMTPLVIIALILLQPFLRLWINGSFSEKATPIGVILLGGIWINAIAYAPSSYLQGRGRPDITAKFHLLELFPYMAVLWLMVEHSGMEGAALAWSLRVTVDALLLIWAGKVGVRQWKNLIIPTFIIVLAVYLSLALLHLTAWRISGEIVLLLLSIIWVNQVGASELRKWVHSVFSQKSTPSINSNDLYRNLETTPNLDEEIFKRKVEDGKLFPPEAIEKPGKTNENIAKKQHYSSEELP